MDFTINFGAINLLVVFAATVSANLLAGVWHSPLLFGKIWRAGNNLPPSGDGMNNSPWVFVASFIFQLLAASMLAAMLGPNAGGVEGVQLGTLIAFTFVLTAMASTNLFEKRPVSLIFVNAGCHIVAFGLMGFIIGTWG